MNKLSVFAVAAMVSFTFFAGACAVEREETKVVSSSSSLTAIKVKVRAGATSRGLGIRAWDTTMKKTGRASFEGEFRGVGGDAPLVRMAYDEERNVIKLSRNIKTYEKALAEDLEAFRKEAEAAGGDPRASGGIRTQNHSTCSDEQSTSDLANGAALTASILAIAACTLPPPLNAGCGSLVYAAAGALAAAWQAAKVLACCQHDESQQERKECKDDSAPTDGDAGADATLQDAGTAVPDIEWE